MSKHNQYKTDFLDLDKLFDKYRPLLNSMYARFAKWGNLYHSQSDYEDLRAQIDAEFMRLCAEYDPTRGIDFPGYISFHLQHRVYHYVTKFQRRQSQETTSYGKPLDDLNTLVDYENTNELIDYDTEAQIDRIEALEAFDWRAIVGEKYRRIVEYVLFEGRTLEEIAELENIDVPTVRLRFNFICDKLRRFNLLQRNFEVWKKNHPGKTFDDYLKWKKLRRKAIR